MAWCGAIAPARVTAELEVSSDSLGAPASSIDGRRERGAFYFASMD